MTAPSWKKPGICYALAEEGVELPVIDVTHPAFRLDLTAEDMERSLADHIATLDRRERLPGLLRRLLLPFYRRRSVLLRGVLEAQGSFLSGMNTYLMKLGPDNLGPGFCGRLDRKVAASFPALSARVRLQEAARHLALALEEPLAARPGAPLHFLNIAGGPASDSLNALLLLRRDHPALLPGRTIHIHVLDLHKEAPRFGERSLAALGAEGGPLHGLPVAFEHLDYHWSDTAVLRALLGRLEPGAVVVGSSEGGLFVYGSDGEIRDNLQALKDGTPEDFTMVVSVTWDTPMVRRSRRFSRLSVRYFTREGFADLLRGTGWRPEKVLPGPTRQIVSLVKSPSSP